MKDFYELIKAKIEANLTAYKTVKLWNNQDIDLKDLQSNVLTFPAVFVDFDFNETVHLAMGIKRQELTVRFRFMFENYTHDHRAADMDFITAFSAEFELWAGREADALQFTPFHEDRRGLDEDHDMINFPFIEYKTSYLNQENYTRATQSPLALTGDITKIIY